MKRTRRVLEYKPDRILTLQGSVAWCLGEAAAEYVDPVNNVSLTHVIIADEYYCLILSITRRSNAPPISGS